MSSGCAIRYRGYATPWFDALFASREELASIVEGSGWAVQAFVDEGAGYVAVLDKDVTDGPTARDTIAAMPDRLYFTGDDEADALNARDPLALLIGFALDQQVTVPTAFLGPLKLQRRLGHLDAERIAAMDPAELEAAFRERPAVHRFPGAMAEARPGPVRGDRGGLRRRRRGRVAHGGRHEGARAADPRSSRGSAT